MGILEFRNPALAICDQKTNLWPANNQTARPLQFYRRRISAATVCDIWPCAAHRTCAIMMEAATVRGNHVVPLSGIIAKIRTCKFFDIKILPASDCAQ